MAIYKGLYGGQKLRISTEAHTVDGYWWLFIKVHTVKGYLGKLAQFLDCIYFNSHEQTWFDGINHIDNKKRLTGFLIL